MVGRGRRRLRSEVLEGSPLQGEADLDRVLDLERDLDLLADRTLRPLDLKDPDDDRDLALDLLADLDLDLSLTVRPLEAEKEEVVEEVEEGDLERPLTEGEWEDPGLPTNAKALLPNNKDQFPGAPYFFASSLKAM